MVRTRNPIDVPRIGQNPAGQSSGTVMQRAHREVQGPVQHRRAADRASLVALAHHDVPGSFVQSRTRQLCELATQLEELVPAHQRGGHQVSLCGTITLYVVGTLHPVPKAIIEAECVRLEQVTRTQAEVEQVSALAWAHVPDDLSRGVFSDFFDPELNGLRVEVAPWWEGTAAQLSRHLGVPVEITMRGVEHNAPAVRSIA